MSLRVRLNLVIGLSMVTIVGLGALFTIHNARRSIQEELQSALQLASRYAESRLAGAKAESDWPSPPPADALLTERFRHLSIRLHGPGQSSTELTTPDRSPSGRSVPAWFAWGVNPGKILQRRTLQLADNQVTLLIEADPADEIAEAWGEARVFFALILLQALLVYLLTQFTLGRALLPVPAIVKGLEAIAQGHYEQRVPSFSLGEFSRISTAINRTAAALEKTQAENRTLTARTLTIQEEERRTLARELHDELGQSLTGIKVMAVSLAKEGNPAARQQTSERLVAVCDRLFTVTRAMIRRLRPAMLDELGLIPSLEDLVEQWEAQNPGIQVHLGCTPETGEAGDLMKIHLFRMVQEALNNVARHARADQIRITVQAYDRPVDGTTDGRSETWLRVAVSDNGKGFDPEANRSGFGLLGLRERAETLGGRFRLSTAHGEGTRVEIEVPLESAQP